MTESVKEAQHKAARGTSDSIKGSSIAAAARIPFALNVQIKAAEVNPATKQRLAMVNIEIRNPNRTKPQIKIIAQVKSPSRSEFIKIFL